MEKNDRDADRRQEDEYRSDDPQTLSHPGAPLVKVLEGDAHPERFLAPVATVITPLVGESIEGDHQDVPTTASVVNEAIRVLSDASHRPSTPLAARGISYAHRRRP
jgi:hypothetical protein